MREDLAWDAKVKELTPRKQFKVLELLEASGIPKDVVSNR